MKYKVLLLSLLMLPGTLWAEKCDGHFVNPFKDVCYRCLFPLTIGHSNIVNSRDGLKDTTNPDSIINTCGSRIGLQIGYWEPMALVDVTDTPYCFVNLGGARLAKSHKRGGRLQNGMAERQAFYHVHWYKYPLMVWLNILTSLSCQEGGDFDVLWMTELDPAWRDSSLAFVLNPDAAFFANAAAQSSCSADAISSTTLKQPVDSLFWCAGAQGSHYPLTGHMTSPLSPVQMAFLLTERMNYKLHRQQMITDSIGKDGLTCRTFNFPVTPKSRYRYELVNQVADGSHCYPSGFSALEMEAGKIMPHQTDQYGMLVWRKRNCTFL